MIFDQLKQEVPGVYSVGSGLLTFKVLDHGNGIYSIEIISADGDVLASLENARAEEVEYLAVCTWRDCVMSVQSEFIKVLGQ